MLCVFMRTIKISMVKMWTGCNAIVWVHKLCVHLNKEDDDSYTCNLCCNKI